MVKTCLGSCHCGSVRFEADIDLAAATYRCNCSICARTRFWAAVVEPSSFRRVSGESELTSYLFNSNKNAHYFCKRCGVRAFGIGDFEGAGRRYGVNLGCLDNVSPEELAAAPVTYVDGKHDNWHQPPTIVNYL